MNSRNSVSGRYVHTCFPAWSTVVAQIIRLLNIRHVAGSMFLSRGVLHLVTEQSANNIEGVEAQKGKSAASVHPWRHINYPTSGEIKARCPYESRSVESPERVIFAIAMYCNRASSQRSVYSGQLLAKKMALLYLATSLQRRAIHVRYIRYGVYKALPRIVLTVKFASCELSFSTTATILAESWIVPAIPGTRGL
jgi:hypothetical protein